MRIRLAALLVIPFVLSASATVRATMPPFGGGQFPDLMLTRMAERPDTFTLKSAFLGLVRTLQQNKFELLSRPETDRPLLPYKLSGSRSIPVLMVRFRDTKAEPYPPADLQKAIFDGPPGSGTVGDYYREVSYGAFSVTGRAFGWKKLSKAQADYAGGTGCFGTCLTSQVSQMVREALQLAPEIDWGAFDNDGPDGKPNSGDDNGIVDFVALQHPGRGGECRGNQNLWSHQSSLSPAQPVFVTKTRAPNGRFLTIDDYVVVPALSCRKEEERMIEIGVFAHEFGHALGLPDLYSTNRANPSLGAGNWCLMGTGSWGGDGVTPERPTHPSAWAKTFLGWVAPTVVTSPKVGVAIDPVETVPAAYSASVGGSVYYLTERLGRSGSNAKLPASGLLVWRIDESVVSAELPRNRINWDVDRPGIVLVEADDARNLRTGQSAADAGDVFRGSPHNPKFDATTKPTAEGTFAMCTIEADGTKADIGFGGTCPLTPGQINPFGAANPGPARGGRGGAPIDAPPSGRTRAPAGLTVATLVRAAAELLDQTVSITARLDNAGSNYFTDRRIVLMDANGVNMVPVQLTGLTNEVFASPTGVPGEALRLSDLLGQMVDVTGRLTQIADADGRRSVMFVVERVGVRR